VSRLANCRQLQPTDGTVNRAWDSAARRSKRYLLGRLQLDLFQQVLPRFEHIHLYKAAKADLEYRWHKSHLRDSAACRLFEMCECRSVILWEFVGKDLHMTPLIPLKSQVRISGPSRPLFTGGVKRRRLTAVMPCWISHDPGETRLSCFGLRPPHYGRNEPPLSGRISFLDDN
jgi:hypothetical protein